MAVVTKNVTNQILQIFYVLIYTLVGIENDGNKTSGLEPYVSGQAVGMINYANTERTCIKAVFKDEYSGLDFFEHLPYILLIQTLSLIVIEKFTFRIPRIAQRVERFYKVRESIFSNYKHLFLVEHKPQNLFSHSTFVDKKIFILCFQNLLIIFW